MKQALTSFFLLAAIGLAQQPLSPAKSTEVTINGKKLSIQYSAPSLRGRTNIFGPGGVISSDPTYPVWRAGANAATAFHTDANLTLGNLNVSKGDYTLFVDTGSNPWQLIINKQTGQFGTDYDKSQDLGRVRMTVSKPTAPIEQFKITLSGTGGNNGKLQLEWENVVASVNFTMK